MSLDKPQARGPHTEMLAELECAICYLTYNAGRRCPRELRCKHTFCESCLTELSRDPALGEAHHGPGRAIVCPLCRHATSISDEGRVRAELRVDERVLEQLLVTGALLEPEEDPEEEDPEEGGQGACEHGAPPESAAEDTEARETESRSRFRRTMRKVWRNICRKNSPQSHYHNPTDMSSDDMRNLAMMACYMF